MRAGRLGFLREAGLGTEARPDIAVAGPKLWGMVAVIIASTAALLGTSDVDRPFAYVRFDFSRESIDGGVVDLTVDRPSATFFVNVTATELGPQDVISTADAQALVDAALEAEGLSARPAPPSVTVRITSTSGQLAVDQSIAQSLSQSFALPFVGNCRDPRAGAACTARFSVEVRRDDDGEAGGTLRFAWHFALTALARVEKPGATEDVLIGPLDPPWTVQVTEP
jgi:hypothetical protein